jgi:hypothetical protein
MKLNNHLIRGFLIMITVAFIVVLVLMIQYKNDLDATHMNLTLLEDQSEQLESKWQTEREALKGHMLDLNKSLSQKEELIETLPQLDEAMLDELKRNGFTGSATDIIEQVKLHKEWIPYDGVLGGTMQFEEIYVLSDRWFMGTFGDGHLFGYGLFKYVIVDGKVRLDKVVDSYIYGEPSANDCSRIDIPKNTERNTSLDPVKKILTVSWYDETIGKDVTYKIDYTRTDCTESVKELISHVLGDDVTGGLDHQKMGYKSVSSFVKTELTLGLNQEAVQLWFGGKSAEPSYIVATYQIL